SRQPTAAIAAVAAKVLTIDERLFAAPGVDARGRQRSPTTAQCAVVVENIAKTLRKISQLGGTERLAAVLARADQRAALDVRVPTGLLISARRRWLGMRRSRAHDCRDATEYRRCIK